MVFQEGDNVPLWMTPQERVDKNFSQYDWTKLKDKTNAELLSNI